MLPDPGGAEALLAARAPVETLVPADVAGLRAAAGVLRSSAATLEQAGSALSRVEVTQWRGDASTSFDDRISVEPARWRAASDAFLAGAVALERYGEDVVSARSTAAEAVEVYGRYADTVDALSGQPVSTVGKRVVALQTSLDPSAATAADALRRQDLDLLDRARTAVVGAGDTAAAALVAACSEAPEARQFWESSIRPAGVTEAGHTALDALGLVPVVGDPADGANALWYAHDGDYGNASMSAAGLVPVFGELLILEKFGRRIVIRHAADAGRTGAEAVGQRTLARLADGGLAAHELGDGFHTIARHVGWSDEQLSTRILTERIRKASTFDDIDTAERYTYANLGNHEAQVERFMASREQSLELRTIFDHPTGRTMLRGSSTPVDANMVVTVISKDPSMPNEFRIVTSFPDVE